MYLVAVIHGGSDLAEDPSGLRLVEDFALAQVVVEFAAGRVLHDQDHLLLVLKHFVDVDDVGVAHRRHDLNFAANANQIGFRFDFGLFDRLDGHL